MGSPYIRILYASRKFWRILIWQLQTIIIIVSIEKMDHWLVNNEGRKLP